MIRKLFAILIISVILFSQASFVLAAEATDCAEYCADPTLDPPSGRTCLCSPIGAGTLQELIGEITNYAFWLAIVIAPLMILWGAWTFMTSAGDPARVETGKKIIFWTIAGLALILLSRVIIGIIRFVLTG